MNHTLLLDYYELTMSNGYLLSDKKDEIAYFDVFFRKVPDGGGFAIAAGLQQIIEYIKELKFDDADIAYLESKKTFAPEFLEYLRNFKFTGDIYAIPEGTPIFPGEPIITVKAPAIEAQIIETFLLLTVNHQCLIATKANRIVRAAQGRTISEFGSRRAQGSDGAILGARAAYIGGVHATACAITDRIYGVPATGTMAHSWVQMFDSEYEAFDTYCKLYPKGVTLLVDTYDVLHSGIPNAIKAFEANGIQKCAIRIDSGDITYLSKRCRQMLDAAGYPQCKIVVSNSLDEYIIRDLLMQGAPLDAFGVGERLITSRSEPVFGGVYKLCAVEKNGELIPKMKVSENVEKITNPSVKKVYRLYDNATGKAEADLIALANETFDDTKPLELFDPNATWKRKVYENYTLRELLVPVVLGGEIVYQSPSVEEIRAYCIRQVDTLWDEVKRFENPHTYYVDLSQELWDLKHQMLSGARK